ncbi:MULTISPECIES: hypothetical protein [unclassified Corynebacterium]|uniref:hypothetical protein n=1 Tax=unclassified Corynebacterium TaxID=2624378 RepID=UPI0025505181|nr:MULTISPECIES: hypothetical protein [unclassified Corynebacterium]MDK8243526.1 hypothetical protein [Corynebacterium sp. UMB10321]MDK8364432.1 hypothetical protein [Corynebacterium sp. UMB10119B]
MQLELRRTNDAELVERKRTLMTRLGEELGERRLTPGWLRFLADSGSFTLQERAIYDEFCRVKALLQEG